jgi:hypothetical protein
MAFESMTKFLLGSRLVFRSILFIAKKMGDLRLQEPEQHEFTMPGADRFPPTPVRVGLACEARPEHESNGLGESKSDLSGGSTGHCEICCPITADSIYRSLLESDSDGDQEIFMVGQGEPPIDQTEEEIAQATEAEVA